MSTSPVPMPSTIPYDRLIAGKCTLNELNGLRVDDQHHYAIMHAMNCENIGCLGLLLVIFDT